MFILLSCAIYAFPFVCNPATHFHDNVLEAASIEESLRIAYQQLNDTQLDSAASLDQSYFDGIESGEVIYTFDRYKTVSEKVEKGVSDAANAMRVFFRFYGKKKYANSGPNSNHDTKNMSL